MFNSMDSELQFTSPRPSDMTFHMLEKITNGFSDNQKLGSGGFGVVYKGVLEDGQEIAVKKLHRGLGLDDKQFRNELENLMRLKHRNIVQLVGYCYEIRHIFSEYEGKQVLAAMSERVICLEYLHNGSLEKYISDESSGLDWCRRFEIIKGVCEGLNYLHEGGENCIYHLDLKPANILLDKNMVPKIADFGLSRLFDGTQIHTTENIIGTRRYMPAEYINLGKISKKVDIFSLGVVIIEIMTGPHGLSKSAYMSSQEFVEQVYGNWRNRLQEEWRDSLLECYCQQVKRCIRIALNCVVSDWDKRPSTWDIIGTLNESETVIQTSSLENALLSVSLQSSRFGEDELNNIDRDLTVGKEVKLMAASCDQSEKMVGFETTIHLTSERYRQVLSIDVHSRETWILTSHKKGHVCIWNYHTQSTINSFQVTKKPVCTAKFIERKQWFVAGDYAGFIYVYNYNTNHKVRSFRAGGTHITSLAVHPTQPYVLSASNDHLIKLWDWQKGWNCTQIFEGHKDIVWQVMFNPKDSNTFASVSDDWHVKIWSLCSPNHKFYEHSEDLLSVDYFTLGDRQYLITGSWEGNAHVWDLQTDKCVETLKGHERRLSAICSHDELPILFTGSYDGTVRQWSSTTFRLKAILNCDLGEVRALYSFKGSKWVAIGHSNGLTITVIEDEQQTGGRDSDSGSSLP